MARGKGTAIKPPQEVQNVKTPEQYAAEQRRWEEEERERFEKASFENFARNVALNVSHTANAGDTDGAKLGKWAADFVKAFRDGLAEDQRTPNTPAPETATEPGSVDMGGEGG